MNNYHSSSACFYTLCNTAGQIITFTIVKLIMPFIKCTSIMTNHDQDHGHRTNNEFCIRLDIRSRICLRLKVKILDILFPGGVPCDMHNFYILCIERRKNTLSSLILSIQRNMALLQPSFPWRKSRLLLHTERMHRISSIFHVRINVFFCECFFPFIEHG